MRASSTQDTPQASFPRWWPYRPIRPWKPAKLRNSPSCLSNLAIPSLACQACSTAAVESATELLESSMKCLLRYPLVPIALSRVSFVMHCILHFIPCARALRTCVRCTFTSSIPRWHGCPMNTRQSSEESMCSTSSEGAHFLDSSILKFPQFFSAAPTNSPPCVVSP